MFPEEKPIFTFDSGLKSNTYVATGRGVGFADVATRSYTEVYLFIVEDGDLFPAGLELTGTSNSVTELDELEL